MRSKPDHGHSRPPLARMLRIHQELQAGKYPTATRLATELEVSTKSIHRDLEFMRDRLQLPLEWDGSKFGYHYTEQVNAFPTMQITEGELFALVVAEKALEQYRGTNFEKPLLSALGKIEQALPHTISLNLTDIEQTISFRTRAEPIIDLQIFNVLSKTTASRQQVELTYRKPGQKQEEQRLIDPYHLANINGEWFLFAYDHVRQTFGLLFLLALRRFGAPAKRFSGRKSSRLNAGCATASACVQARKITISSFVLTNTQPITFVKRNGTLRRGFEN